MDPMARLLPLLLVLSYPLLAQDAPKPYPGYGYAYAGGARLGEGFGDFLSLGGGGEWIFRNGAGVGFGNGVGLASLNGSYYFLGFSSSGKWAPFATAGSSLAFRGGAAFLVNYGGGVTYWFRPKVGLQIEARNHHHREIALFTLRIGVSFR